MSPPSGVQPAAMQRELLTGLLQDHASGAHLCVIGGKGSGKSVAAQLFARRLGYVQELFPLYKDMSTRDLLQRRATDASGGSTWHASPLVSSAVRGRLSVLDGAHRLPGDSLAVLQRLLLDAEMDLPDGSRLVPLGAYREHARRIGHEACDAADERNLPGLPFGGGGGGGGVGGCAACLRLMYAVHP